MPLKRERSQSNCIRIFGSLAIEKDLYTPPVDELGHSLEHLAATGDGHVIDIKKSWKQICELAKLDNFRIHDLRHSFASRVISATGSLYVTGQLLGHTQAQTTARYAHLLDNVMREATESASKRLTGR